jgi:hypothetical protein
MGGPSGGSSGGGATGSHRAAQDKGMQKKSAVSHVVDFVKGGGTVGYVLGKIGEANKANKEQNRRDKLTSQFASEEGPKDLRTGRSDGDNDNDNPNSLVQPKVVSQMDNSKVKSNLIIADKTAPTSIEMTQDEIKIANKRGKKTKTILTSVVGDKSNATLSKKVLLG